MKRHKVTRIGIEFLDRCADIHLKDLVVDDMDDHRGASILGRRVVNFGSDSFLGLDQDERVQEAAASKRCRGGARTTARRGRSPASPVCRGRSQAGGVAGHRGDADLPVVTLANPGLIPALVAKDDLLVVDEQAHNSIQQGRRRSPRPTAPASSSCTLAGAACWKRCSRPGGNGARSWRSTASTA